jgi:hypothetical protein
VFRLQVERDQTRLLASERRQWSKLVRLTGLRLSVPHEIDTHEPRL